MSKFKELLKLKLRTGLTCRRPWFNLWHSKVLQSMVPQDIRSDPGVILGVVAQQCYACHYL